MSQAPRHVLSARDFHRGDIEAWIERAEDIRSYRQKWQGRHAGAVVATLFYEPSTRTRLSFEAAAARLGAHVISSENALEHSSAKKGESLADVYRIVGGYADAIVIRHHETGELERNAKYSPVPIINAGSGAGEHPTQALLDLYTIWREIGRLDDFTICLMGDLKYGRTVHSLLTALGLFNNIRVRLYQPNALRLPAEVLERALADGVDVTEADSFADAAIDADIVYQTRIQAERLADADEAKDATEYWLTPSRVAELKPSARILHPLPRVHEIDPVVDTDARAAYFRQAENGLYLRMALLHKVLSGELERMEACEA